MARTGCMVGSEWPLERLFGVCDLQFCRAITLSSGLGVVVPHLPIILVVGSWMQDEDFKVVLGYRT